MKKKNPIEINWLSMTPSKENAVLCLIYKYKEWFKNEWKIMLGGCNNFLCRIPWPYFAALWA